MPDVREEFTTLLGRMKVWSRGESVAVHKPFLCLVALAGVQRGEARLTNYDTLADRLRPLLVKYSSTGGTTASYPFWRLQNDGLWEVVADGPLRPRASNTDPSVRELRTKHARGGFPVRFHKLLLADQAFLGRSASFILSKYFAVDAHSAIANDIGLRLRGT